jgi:hypothetical protein
MSSGSSSVAKLLVLCEASESASLRMANFLTEQPVMAKVTITRSAQIPCMRQADCGSCK